jgi:dUTP pyrophosphatase
MKVKIKKASPDVPTPAYQTAGAAGCDVTSTENVRLIPGLPTIVSTGLFLEVPEGYECQVRPRSGLATKGITVMNSPGTIDSDYRGELKIILINHGDYSRDVAIGDRIAQLVFAPVTRAEFEVVDDLSDTSRGAGGFGSTGVK